jgi:acyl-CoA reductase-like NAD-dependent aldehyde dehydrogenase/4-aminobutyrate aminotransferase-like enzyme/GNAT superfamily N-acetyltransferase
MKALGDFIGGVFLSPDGEPLRSHNPARDGEVVLETRAAVARVGEACSAADQAFPAWHRLSMAERWAHLERFRQALVERAGPLADAIVAETGKIRAEAQAEAAGLAARFALVREQAERDLAAGRVPGTAGEELRYHPLGVVGVVGPFNFPLHLCHVHVVPALLLGNTVVVKPSEVTPLCGQVYAEAAHAAGLPAGVLNVVQGAGAAGAALALQPAVRALCFTGSYATGRRIKEATLDRPELLLALEMGGKNTAVVAEDADLRQAVHEIVTGAYLTTGQRCTATERLLVHAARLDELLAMLVPLVRGLRFGDPDDGRSFAGPLTTQAGRARFLAALEQARGGGAQLLASSEVSGAGLYAPATLHRLPDGCHALSGYTDTELFGPDLCVESFGDDAEAIAVLEASPYAFACSVFTADRERSERYYRETRCGIFNRNRSTNQASPRLPFGGLGRSGNHRPAGAFAHRNLVAPVAVQENVLAALSPHPQLLARLPPPDLDRLERQHVAEEAEEAGRNFLDAPRPMAMQLPAGGRLPRSEEWLTRLYAGDRVVREKKQPVFDHLRSVGPWLVSVDDDCLSVLDGMSQTATSCGGFAEDSVVRAYVEGAFGDSLVSTTDTAIEECEAARDLATLLRQQVPGLPHVSFTSSGAEAVEKALALARLHAPGPAARRVLAFEGSFHGRTVWALHATHSPAKRVPFELSGHEVNFVPFPVWDRPGRDEPAAPAGFFAAVAAGDVDALLARHGDPGDDPLVAAETQALVAVSRALASGEYFALIVEPMQSEGGDRYATARFFRALRLLTRHHEVALIFDEVQTGFGLGCEFAWHTRFRLVNSRGRPDHPDLVTFAKRAQLGIVMSRFEDPEPTSAHPASLVRGCLHADMMATAHNAERIERLVKPRLQALAQAFPHLVSAPRACGYAMAFELPDPAHLQAYLEQRFWRGAVVFAAGTRTVRYRLSEAFHAREIDELFAAMRRSLAWLDAHPGARPPAWEDSPAPARGRLPPGTHGQPAPRYRVRLVGSEEAINHLGAILEIEQRVYEPARQTAPAHIREALENPEGIVIIAEVFEDGRWKFVGFAIGTPLECAADVEGPDRDPMLGRHNTLYSASITMAPEYQGLGVGRAIKEAQLREAYRRRRRDGSPRYRYVTGRNRVGHTARMTHLNRVFGAHLVAVLTGQYEDPEGQAIYYRIPLGAVAPDVESAAPPEGKPSGVDFDLADGLCRPLARPPESLVQAERRGLLYGPAVNKLTLMNYVTPAVVRALEWVSALLPELPHLYLTCGRDELIDKSVRLLRWHRRKAHTLLGFEGCYVGHTTGAARSLSDPALHAQGPGVFDWPRLPHPAEVGTAAAIEAVRAAVRAAGGADAVLGLLYEPVQERTGRVMPADFLAALDGVRRELGTPVVAVETATACYRSGRGPFAVSGQSFLPDVVAWWGGAQNGYMHVSPALFVRDPLTFVSTWDGDELSMVREYHQLRAARRMELAPAIAELDEVLAQARRRGLPGAGLGLYRVLDAGARAPEVEESLARHRLRGRRLPGGRLALLPGLDEAALAVRALGQALAEVR